VQRREAGVIPAFLRAPAWAFSSGCKSRRKLVTVSDVKRNCGRATDRGRMDTQPATGHPTQAVAAPRDDLAGVDGARSQACGYQSSGGECSLLVAQQRDAPQLRPHDPMGRPVGSAQARLTSVPRTAGCGPPHAGRCGRGGRNDHPLCRLLGSLAARTCCRSGPLRQLGTSAVASREAGQAVSGAPWPLTLAPNTSVTAIPTATPADTAGGVAYRSDARPREVRSRYLSRSCPSLDGGASITMHA
jgi:hypothetical protein